MCTQFRSGTLGTKFIEIRPQAHSTEFVEFRSLISPSPAPSPPPTHCLTSDPTTPHCYAEALGLKVLVRTPYFSRSPRINKPTDTPRSLGTKATSSRPREGITPSEGGRGARVGELMLGDDKGGLRLR